MPPLFTPIIRERTVCFGILLVGVILVAGQSLGLTLYVCPYKAATGIPCPGCGLTRGTTALLKGQWEAAWSYHPFSWLVIPGLIIVILASFLNPYQRGVFLGGLEKVERYTGIGWLALSSLMAFGIWRMGQ